MADVAQITKIIAQLEAIDSGLYVTKAGAYAELEGSGLLVTQMGILVELEESGGGGGSGGMATNFRKAGSRAIHHRLPQEVTGYALDPSWSWWTIVVPEASINYLYNGSFEDDPSTYWNENGSFDAVNTGRSQYPEQYSISGRYIYKLKPSNDSSYLESTQTGDTHAAGDWCFSAWVKGTPGAQFYLELQRSGTKIVRTTYTIEQDDWVRYEVAGTTTASGTLKCIIGFGTADAIYYVDACQLENKLYATTYFDGDTVDPLEPVGFSSFSWSGARFASTSVRRRDTRAGGREYNLADDLHFYTTGIIGLGMSAISLRNRELADGTELYDGAFFGSRDFTITGRLYGKNWAELSLKRDTLINLLKPDLTADRRPIVLRYQPTDSRGRIWSRAAEITCNYVSGMEGNINNLYTENLPLKFHASQAAIKDTAWDSKAITFTNALDNTNILIRWRNGDYIDTGSGAGTVEAGDIAKDITWWRDRFIVVGAFTGWIDDADLNDTVYWDGEDATAWEQFGGADRIFDGDGPDYVKAGEYDWEDFVFVGGKFTQWETEPAGVQVNECRGIAYQSVEESIAPTAWDEIGGGVAGGTDAKVKAIVFIPGGDFYIFGDFTTSGDTVTNHGYMAVLDYTDGSPIPDFSRICDDGDGANGIVYDAVLGPEGYVYFCGDFTTVSQTTPVTVTANRVAYIIPGDERDEDQFGVMGDGFSDPVERIWVGKDNKIYVLVNQISSTSDYRVYQWTGSTWIEWHEFVSTAVVRDVAVDRNGDFHFTGYGIGAAPSQAHWTVGSGNVFFHGEVYSDNTAVSHHPKLIAIDAERDQIGLSTFSKTWNGDKFDCGAITTITNYGKTESYPVIHINGPATPPLYIRNLTTGVGLYFDRSFDLGLNERMTIDLSGPQPIMWTNSRNTIKQFFIGGVTDFRGFRLLPGENIIRTVLTGTDGNTDMWFEWRNTHWSIDPVGGQ